MLLTIATRSSATRCTPVEAGRVEEHHQLPLYVPRVLDVGSLAPFCAAHVLDVVRPRPRPLGIVSSTLPFLGVISLDVSFAPRPLTPRPFVAFSLSTSLWTIRLGFWRFLGYCSYLPLLLASAHPATVSGAV